MRDVKSSLTPQLRQKRPSLFQLAHCKLPAEILDNQIAGNKKLSNLTILNFEAILKLYIDQQKVLPIS